MTLPSSHHSMGRRGGTLIELLIALGLVMILGIAVTRLLIWQSRFYDAQTQGREARSASRSGMTLLLNEWRTLNATGSAASDTVDVESVSTTSLTLRVPFARGLVCANTGAGAGSVYLTLLPVDSLVYAQATDVTTGGLLGYAWRDPGSGGRYHYVELGSMPTVGSTFTAAAQCSAGNIGAAANGGFLEITPGIPIGGAFISPPVGASIYLYQRLRYRFAASVAIPGATALWRDVLRTGASEEIAAPLGNGSQFSWFLKSDSQLPLVAVPVALASIAGFQITMNGVSERTAEGATAPASALVSTSIFFRNRLD